MSPDLRIKHCSATLATLAAELVAAGRRVKLSARGQSMAPAICDGETVELERVDPGRLRVGDIVLATTNNGMKLHRLVRADAAKNIFVTQGDLSDEPDLPVCGHQILGRVFDKPRETSLWSRVQSLLLRRRRRFIQALPASTILPLLAVMLLLPAGLRAQVAVDSASSGSGTLAGAGTPTLTITHTTSAGANRVLIVAVSMNIVADTSHNTQITSISYNAVPAQPMTFVGAHNDAANSHRVEMWQLINPASGGPFNIVITVSIPTAHNVGVVAGAVTFTGADQTTPVLANSFVSADGAAAAFSQLNVPSGINQIPMDVVAADGSQTITVGVTGQTTPQVSRWNVSTGNNTNPAVAGAGSTQPGGASVPFSEQFSGTSNWAQAGLSIQPLQADLGLTVTASGPVQPNQNLTYTIKLTNNGPSTATNVQFTDTLTGLTVNAVNQGTATCNGTAPVTCSIATLAPSASVSVTVTANATATPGSYPSTAAITGSTQPDFNTGNNTFTSVGIVQSNACSLPGNDGTGAIGGATALNTYYPGAASVAAGATSIPVGAPTGSPSTISTGDRLLVIQMQDASINSTNSTSYGNGSNGAGFTAQNNAGNYEFVTATGPVAGGSVPIQGAGASGGLIFGYTAAAATATKGQSTYQVIRVPQYSTATINAAQTVPAWTTNEAANPPTGTGGVLAFDVAGSLNLNGQTLSLDGLGFRGGAGMQLNGTTGANTDFVHTSPPAYAGTAVAGTDGPKGEGIAGTPQWLEVNSTFLNTTVDGYPNGGMARGAPANAGGGGTDGDPAANDQNSGGGGGANGGAGGAGGDSWSSNLTIGGVGGAYFPATITSMAMGGGGGAATRNNSPGDNQASGGASGGGIVMVHVGSFTGTGTITANGSSAYNGTLNDGGGGGGAGGSIMLLSENGGENNVTVNAAGGNGGNAWQAQAFALNNRHGPGGGGGGGVIFISGAPAASSVLGGTNGLTLNTPAVSYGATAGSSGLFVSNASIASSSGVAAGARCIPDLTIALGHTGSLVRGNSVPYTITVSNASALGSTIGQITVVDTLPAGLTALSATGTGWNCNISGQVLSCTRSDVLAAGSSYPAITLSALVTQTAPASLTDIATVSGGGEINTANDSASDTAVVSSLADLAVTSNTPSDDPATAGTLLNFNQTISNNGPSDAIDVSFVATVPSNTTGNGIDAPSGWTCNPSSSSFTSYVCTIADLPAGSSANFTTQVIVNNSAPNGTVLSETASASSYTPDSNAANNSLTATTSVGSTAQADLTVTNSNTPNPVTPGSQITYTQTVMNIGHSAATSASFSETLPANTTFQSLSQPAGGWSCSTPSVGGTGTISCTATSLAAGYSGAFTVVLNVSNSATAGSTISDTATVGASNDAVAGNNSATSSDLVASSTQADLALTTSAEPTPVIAGDNITYAEMITNNGPASATGAQFTMSVPTGTSFQSVSAPSGWTCTSPAVGATTGTITCTDANSLDSGANAQILVEFNVAPGTTSSITASGSVSSGTSDPSSANNSTTVTNSVITEVDLAVTNSANTNPVNQNTNDTFTQVVTNNGPSTATNLTFTENFPTSVCNTTCTAGVKFVSMATPAGWACSVPAANATTGTITCTIASLAPGATATFNPIYKSDAAASPNTAIITDTATISSSNNDTVPTNNSATVQVGVYSATSQVDLGITDSGSPQPVDAGNNLTYTQVLTNHGPGNLGSTFTITVTETIPANATFVSMTQPAGWNCTGEPAVGGTGTFTCTHTGAAFNNAAIATFSLVVAVNSGTAQGTSIVDNVSEAVSGTSPPPDPDSSNNSASASNDVAAIADIAVTDSATAGTVAPGGNITYNQQITNSGPSAAASATFTEAIPTGTTFVSLTGTAGWSCTTPGVGASGTISCTDSSFASGATSNFQLVVQDTATVGSIISDSVTVGTSTTETNTANNTASATTSVANAGQADLAMANAASPSPVAAGSNVTFTQTVTNNGPASATSPTITETIPQNTTFVSITPLPAGWNCTGTPAAGGTGSFTCSAPSLASGSSASFSFVVQVASTTSAGTGIIDVVSASTTTTDPVSSNNSAAASTTVASAIVANLSIVKSASPSPVLEGNNLTYTITVTNNGPGAATNVVVNDDIPSALDFENVTITVPAGQTGSCSQAGAAVSCLINGLANGATATITLVTQATETGNVTNTATVSGDQNDTTTSNNSSSVTTLVEAPTAITLKNFAARSTPQGTMLVWSTSGEDRNLGFNVYREINGERVRINQTLIAGSALRMRGGMPQHRGRSYLWLDPHPAASSVYWLEDVDLRGTRTMHGPVSAMQSAGRMNERPSPTLAELSVRSTASRQPSTVTHRLENAMASAATTVSPGKQYALAAGPAVKIAVDHEGWYQVTQPQLVAAGLDPNVDPRNLQLYLNGIQQAMRISNSVPGPGGFGPNASIEFYGVPIDTQYTGTSVYWLIAATSGGLRAPGSPALTNAGPQPSSFPYTVELRDRSIYFAALIDSDGNNFFGALISSTPTNQVLTVHDLDTSVSAPPATMTIALQGVTDGFAHDVSVTMNGMPLPDIQFSGETQGLLSMPVPSGVLAEGDNTITLTAQNGDNDVSLVDHIAITYPHTYTAESDALEFTAASGATLAVGGFTAAPTRVIDITNPQVPVQLSFTKKVANGIYTANIQVPWNTSAATHQIIALAPDAYSQASSLTANAPSSWHSSTQGAQIVMIANPAFAGGLDPLVQAHAAAGQTSVVVPLDQLYDEYNYGEPTPYAVKKFLQYAMNNWAQKPQYLLLVGDASFDPRNFLGFGDFDFVPTKIVPTAQLMTASDDWFSDFANNGFAHISTGRLPVRTTSDLQTVVAKIVGYEIDTNQESWNTQAMFVADHDDSQAFSTNSLAVQSGLPKAVQSADVFAGADANAQQDILNGFNSGAVLINYIGHGSTENWSDSDLFDDSSVPQLTNGSALPVVMAFNCLNGFFQDVYTESLAETLLLAPNGGAVAVIASSSLSQPAPQVQLDKVTVKKMFVPGTKIGDALRNAKSGITDSDVRRTYILFGDPAMAVK